MLLAEPYDEVVFDGLWQRDGVNYVLRLSSQSTCPIAAARPAEGRLSAGPRRPMTPGITPIYAATRSALLDALDALAGPHGR